MTTEHTAYGQWYHNGHVEEQDRLDMLAEVFDPGTTAALSEVDVQPHWRCADIGGGRGSIAAWLAERAYQGSTIVADKDPGRRLASMPPSVSYLDFDVTKDEFPRAEFDLVHSRFLLQHLAEREDVLDRMISWLAPGGWLVVGDAFDTAEGSLTHPEYAAFHTELHTALPKILSTDFTWGRRYPDPLVRRGLRDIGCSVFAPPLRGGDTPYALMLASSFDRLRPALVANGTDESLIDMVLRQLRDPDFWDFEFTLVTAWGRRPAE